MAAIFPKSSDHWLRVGAAVCAVSGGTEEPTRIKAASGKPLNKKLLRAHTQAAARLRHLAASVTTPRLKARLLEEAANQEQLAEDARRGTFRPHPSTPGDLHWQRL